MNIKFQRRDPWPVSALDSPPRCCVSRQSSAAASSARPQRRGLLAARLPQASALFPLPADWKKKGLAPPHQRPASRPAPGRGKAEPLSLRLGTAFPRDI